MNRSPCVIVNINEILSLLQHNFEQKQYQFIQNSFVNYARNIRNQNNCTIMTTTKQKINMPRIWSMWSVALHLSSPTPFHTADLEQLDQSRVQLVLRHHGTRIKQKAGKIRSILSKERSLWKTKGQNQKVRGKKYLSKH